jgi:arylsulfatase
MKKINSSLHLIVPTVLSSLFSANSFAETKKPNIIYILADDLGYAELGCYGQQKIETPNIDRLASEGIRFTQFYAGAPVSAPSRSTLLTGLHTGHTPIRGNDEMASRGDVWDRAAMIDNPSLEGQAPMPAGTITIASVLKNGGYNTACIGKWGLGYPGSVSTPDKMGFDFFYGYNCQRQAHDYYPPFLYRNEKREFLDNKVIYKRGQALKKNTDVYADSIYAKYQQKNYAPDLMFKELIQYVQSNKQHPFFLYWATPIPHAPLQAPQKWIDHYVRKFGNETPYTGNKGYYPCRYPRATYAAMISYLDEQVGYLIEELKRSGIYDNTLIIFTSDNGPTFNGGTDSPFFDSAAPFMSEQGWGKTSLNEGGIRVPMIATWKKKIKPNSMTNHMATGWDVMATLCEIAKIKSPATDGISFYPALISKRQKKHRFLYWEFPEAGGSKAVRMGKWKGIIKNYIKGKNRTIKLYDLEQDPREQEDVAEFHPKIIKGMMNIMQREHTLPENPEFRME